ncbi:MAG TPA: class I SAM-dependent methyltransferase [Methanocorpusculum sp.]|nr:class I SAM-dependent methyltransferase [Methanocorpusculum sp.]
MEEVFQSDYKKRGARWAGTADVPKLPPDALVLEAGCGNGKTLKALPAGAVGLDISPEAVRLAGPQRAVAGDIRRMPFSDGVFDCVLCFHVLGHLREAERKTAAAELMRVLKPGGALYFRGFAKGDFRYGRGEETEPDSFLKGDGIMTHFFTPAEVSGLFAGSAGEVCEYSWGLKIRGVVYPRVEVRGCFINNESV